MKKLNLFFFFVLLNPAFALAGQPKNLKISSDHGGIRVDLSCKRDLATKLFTAEVSSVEFSVPESIDFPSERIAFYSGKLGVDNDPALSSAGLLFSADNGWLSVRDAENQQGVAVGQLMSPGSQLPVAANAACQQELDSLIAYTNQEIALPGQLPKKVQQEKDALNYYTNEITKFLTQVYISQAASSSIEIQRHVGKTLEHQDMLDLACKKAFTRDFSVSQGDANLKFNTKGYLISTCH